MPGGGPYGEARVLTAPRVVRAPFGRPATVTGAGDVGYSVGGQVATGWWEASGRVRLMVDARPPNLPSSATRTRRATRFAPTTMSSPRRRSRWVQRFGS